MNVTARARTTTEQCGGLGCVGELALDGEVDMALSHILKPLRINGVVVPNRVARASHATLLGEGGLVGPNLIAYHEARGRGGVGLSILEPLGVHWSAPGAINLFAPNIDEGYRTLVDVVRPTGMKLFQQIWHGGHNTVPLDGSPPWSASDLPGMLVGIPAVRMTKGMIDEIVMAFAEAARRCEEWGIDGVEVHAAHGYLPGQFMSPALNDRDDDYGGSFENRTRFLVEVMQAIRSAVSRHYPVGVRMAPDTLVGGIDPAEALRATQLLETRGLIDFVDLSLGNYQNLATAVAGMHKPAGYQMTTSAAISRGTKLPTIVTGRFRTLEEADQVIRAGDASMVSFVRALIADPDLVKKTAAGRPETVRPCIGCNQACIAQALAPPFRMGCVVNPAIGSEQSMGDGKLLPVEKPLRVLVIGGGPAGMEAARVAALRGHRVTLAEAGAKLGGSVLMASKAPTRHGMIDFVQWQEREVYRLNVTVRMSTYLEGADIKKEDWDAVIVATGSEPRMDGLQQSNPGERIRGMEQPHVLSSHELMQTSGMNLGKSAVVIDDAGHYEGLAVAEYIAAQGIDVTFVTRHISIAPRIESALMVEPALSRLSTMSFSTRLRSRAITIGKDSVVIGPTFLSAAGNHTETIPADTVVFVSLNRSNRAIFLDLEGRGLNVRAVGDATAARHLASAIREGHVAGASI